MGRFGLFFVLVGAAAASGCTCHGVCTKRMSEEKCPTDIRKTHFWCFGEDAIIHGPCGPKEELYGYEPTSWREFPQVAAACYGEAYAEQLNAVPTNVQRLPALSPQEPLPEPAVQEPAVQEPAAQEPVIDPVRAIDPVLPPQSQAPAGDSARRPVPFAIQSRGKPSATSGFLARIDETPISLPSATTPIPATSAVATSRPAAAGPLLSPVSEPLPPKQAAVNVASIDVEQRSGVVGWLTTQPDRPANSTAVSSALSPLAGSRESKQARELRTKYALDSNLAPSASSLDPGVDASLQRIAPTFTR